MNVMFAFLKKNRTLFSSCDSIKRSNIVSLCNLYLQTGNIQVVKHYSQSPEIRNKFKDSSSSYYCFTERAMSTLVQYHRGSDNLKRKSCLQPSNTGESIAAEPTRPMPICKHGSVESLFERIQKSCARRKLKKPSSLDFGSDKKQRTYFTAAGLSPTCLKKISSICFEFGNKLSNGVTS